MTHGLIKKIFTAFRREKSYSAHVRSEFKAGRTRNTKDIQDGTEIFMDGYTMEVIKANVIKCRVCETGTVDRYTHHLECRDCGAVGDLNKWIMQPVSEGMGALK